MKRTKRKIKDREKMWKKLSTVTPHPGNQTIFDVDLNSLYAHSMGGFASDELVIVAAGDGTGKSVIDFESN